MTIDERLEKLAERHEALTQTGELLARQTQTTEVLVREIVKGIHDLVTVVRSHEQRISNFES
jgi:hypothetical protein